MTTERTQRQRREWTAVTTLVSESRRSSLEGLETQPSIVDVPTHCIHDSVVTEALGYLGMRDAFVGRPPDTDLAAELVTTIETQTESEQVVDDQAITLHLPQGKAAIIQAISQECAKTTRQSEAQVMSRFLGVGIDRALRSSTPGER